MRSGASPRRSGDARAERSTSLARTMGWGLALLLATTLMACPKAPPETVDSGEGDGPTEVSFEEPVVIAAIEGNVLIGQEIYERKCQQCHGSAELAVDPSLSRLARQDPERALEIIREGSGEEMPAYGARLPIQLIDDVVIYLQVANGDGTLTIAPK